MNLIQIEGPFNADLGSDSSTPSSSNIFTTETSPNVQLRAQTPNTVIPHPPQKRHPSGHSFTAETNLDFPFENNNEELLSSSSGLGAFSNNTDLYPSTHAMAFSDYLHHAPNSPGKS